MLWTPLFENSENQEETTRNVAAACLGKLTTTHPGRYLPQLHVSPIDHQSGSAAADVHREKARINDPNPATRATVLSAIRYTFAESAASFDELLGGVIMDFLSLLSDADLVSHLVRISRKGNNSYFYQRLYGAWRFLLSILLLVHGRI